MLCVFEDTERRGRKGVDKGRNKGQREAMEQPDSRTAGQINIAIASECML